MNFKFRINDDEWEIIQVDKDKIRNRLNKDNEEDAIFVFGLTIFSEHKIWINEDVCTEQKIKTLKHELTHCYIWSYGLGSVPHYTEEMVCDIVSASINIINDIVKEYIKLLK